MGKKSITLALSLNLAEYFYKIAIYSKIKVFFYTRSRGTTKHQTRSDDVVPQARANNKSITLYL